MIPLLFLLLAGAVRDEQTLQIDGVRETCFLASATNIDGDDHDIRASRSCLKTSARRDSIISGLVAADPKLHAFSPTLAGSRWSTLRDSRSATVQVVDLYSAYLGNEGQYDSEQQSRQTKPRPRPEDAVILDMMTNLHENGFNPTLGGLYINWRYGTSPIQGNFKGSGETDGPGDKPRHDILTDQRYLHNLLLYKHLHPTDQRFDADLDRFRKIIRAEFANSHNERGWLYDEFIDMYRLSGDAFYRDVARGLVESYAAGVSKGAAPVNFKRNANHPGGYYRVDNMLQQGAALIQAAHEFSQPEWEATGRLMLDFIYDHAYFKAYHCFAITMDNLFIPDGKLNPDETIYRDSTGRYTVDGGVVRLGGLGQIVSSLLHAYLATKDKLFLDRAIALMDALSPQPNTLGLWDTRNLGYFNAIVFPGKSQSDPGRPKLSDTKKESGRQAHMLEAAVLANRLTGGRYRKLEDDLVVVTTTKAYYAAGHGVPYEQAADWSLLPLKKGGKEDWVTSEAMGISLMALQQRERQDAW